MEPHQLETLLEGLAATQSQLSDLLTSVAASQDWQPGPEEWSFRFLAAHLATAEAECFQDRIQRIATGRNPSFEYYLNTGRDFSDLDLERSLAVWRTTRLAIFEFVRNLPEEGWSLSGIHAVSGPITIRDVLESTLAHDREHLKELQQTLLTFHNEGGVHNI